MSIQAGGSFRPIPHFLTAKQGDRFEKVWKCFEGLNSDFVKYSAELL